MADKKTETQTNKLERKSKIGVINETIHENDHFAVLDSNVDFAINLFKLYEKTSMSLYFDKAELIINSVLKYFKAPKGYYWKLDTMKGVPLTRTIETKYLGLVLKLLLVFREVSKGKSIFQDPLLRNLARDR